MIIYAYKEEGQLLGELTKNIKEKYNASRICFTGRLDPMAKGKMMYLINDSVDLMDQFLGLNKTYKFNLTIGISTSSGDILGKFNNVHLISHKVLYAIIQKLQITLNKFDNKEYIQKYPCYSSYKIKKNNVKKPLWYFAKHNLLNDDDIPSHKVKVYSILQYNHCKVFYNSKYFIDKILKLKEENNSFNKSTIVDQYITLNTYKQRNHFILQVPLIATVSSGTYIRQLCEDMSEYINYPCCAEGIERTQIYF
jgi:tRNA U55 pseudouridine synthase TruB